MTNPVQYVATSLYHLLAHHPHDSQQTVLGVSLQVQEQAYGIGHQMMLTIVEGPRELVGFQTSVQSAKHAKDARAQCQEELERKVKEFLGQ